MTEIADENPGLPEEVWRTVKSPGRLAVLRDVGQTGSSNDADFDRLTTLAASIFDAPVALVSLVDLKHQSFRSHFGTEEKETPVNLSFCAHAIAAGDDVMIVPDATRDPRFAANALVTGEPRVRFYVGAPIIVEGERIGTLCVIDNVARPAPDKQQIDRLQMLASLAASLFVLKEERRSGALAREALAREEKRRAVALESASLSSWIWNVPAGKVECDESLPELFGLPKSNFMSARKFFLAIDRRDVRQTDNWFRQSLLASDNYSGEYRVKGFDPPRWLASRGRVIERTPEGKPLLVFGVNYDVSERRLAEERQRLLLRELNHRVKNTLATVQALASQTVRYAREPREFLAAFSSRLQSLGRAHGLLSDREWRGISLAELIHLEVSAFDDTEKPRISVEGRHVFLSPDQALGVGIILHELASNASRYGSLSVPDGVVQISWTLAGSEGKRRLVVTWRETGGPTVPIPSREGFGMILIRRSLAKIMSSGVTHEFRPEGVYAEISMELEVSPDEEK